MAHRKRHSSTFKNPRIETLFLTNQKSKSQEPWAARGRREGNGPLADPRGKRKPRPPSGRGLGPWPEVYSAEKSSVFAQRLVYRDLYHSTFSNCTRWKQPEISAWTTCFEAWGTENEAPCGCQRGCELRMPASGFQNILITWKRQAENSGLYDSKSAVTKRLHPCVSLYMNRLLRKMQKKSKWLPLKRVALRTTQGKIFFFSHSLLYCLTFLNCWAA